MRLPAVAVAALAALVLAAPASARSVPRGWLGVQVDGPLAAAGNAYGGEWDVMATSGVETVRVAFDWRTAQPVRGGPISFTDMGHLRSVSERDHSDVRALPATGALQSQRFRAD